ncbi:MAG: type II secretion system F family protein [Planctomycetes bacterium]|nr:type II secretion system F family protein [Planctomycetota bacterium]
MPVFAYEAVDVNGQKIRQEVEAPSKDEAIKRLKSQGFRPTKIALKAGAPAKPRAAGEKKGKKKFVLFDRVSNAQVTTFTTQFAILQDAGLPIVRSIKILETQQRPGKFKDQLAMVAEEVEGGSTLSEALSKHPRTFDKLYQSMVKAGEAGGVLDVILNRLAGFMEKSQKLKKKIQGAMIYPIAVTLVATAILTLIMVVVVPSFESMFKDIGRNLPAMTQMLLSVSRTIKEFWYLFLGVPFVFIISWNAISRSDKGRFMIDKFKLSVPGFGIIVKKSAISRFTRTLGTLIASGVPILEALRIVKDAIGNTVIQGAIEQVHGSIREGETVADPLRASGVFDELVVNMIDVGEETGELDKMLIKIADNYENDVDVAVEGMSSLIEPILIVGMGVAVGFIVVALFLPLIEIIKTIH